MWHFRGSSRGVQVGFSEGYILGVQVRIRGVHFRGSSKDFGARGVHFRGSSKDFGLQGYILGVQVEIARRRRFF